jgi:hypothetical protein
VPNDRVAPDTLDPLWGSGYRSDPEGYKDPKRCKRTEQRPGCRVIVTPNLHDYEGRRRYVAVLGEVGFRQSLSADALAQGRGKKLGEVGGVMSFAEGHAMREALGRKHDAASEKKKAKVAKKRAEAALVAAETQSVKLASDACLTMIAAFAPGGWACAAGFRDVLLVWGRSRSEEHDRLRRALGHSRAAMPRARLVIIFRA